MLYPCNRVHKSRSTYCKQVQNFDIIEGSRAKTKQKPKKKKKRRSKRRSHVQIRPETDLERTNCLLILEHGFKQQRA